MKKYFKVYLVILVGLVALLLSALTAAKLQKSNSVAKTGTLHGTVTLYPIGPICSNLSQCSRPAAGQPVELRRLNNTTAASASANTHGEYKFRVEPGTYNLVVPAARYGRPGTHIPNPIQVKANTSVSVDVTIDTGIR